MKKSIDPNGSISRADILRLVELDDLVVRASQGDRRAIGAIAVAFGPQLLREARAALGPMEEDCDDVVQDFFLSLVEGRTRFVPERKRALEWMFGIVRAIARKHRADREDDWSRGWSSEVEDNDAEP
jgi:DNA-directed RNA polymerase specialized sigma24 family protein